MSNKLIKSNKSVKSNEKVKCGKGLKIVCAGMAVALVSVCTLGTVYPKIFVKAHNFVVGSAELELKSNKITAIKYDPNDIVKSIGEYDLKDLVIEDSYEITEEDVEDYMDYFLQDYSTTIDYENGHVVEGDETVNVNYEGTVDGETFDGGTAEDAYINLAEDEYIPGFAENIVGHCVGDTFSFDVDFPKEYEESLAGKHAVFKVTINSSALEIKYDHTNVTEKILRDNTAYESLDEFKEYCRTYVTGYYADLLDSEKKQAIMNAIKENTDCDVPDDVLQNEVDMYEQQFINLYCIDTDLEGYVSDNYGMTVDQFREQIKEDVATSFTNVVICEKLAQDLGVTLSDDQYKKYVAKLVEGTSYGTESYDELYSVYGTDYMDGEKYIRRMALCDAVMEELMSKASFIVDSEVSVTEGSTADSTEEE